MYHKAIEIDPNHFYSLKKLGFHYKNMHIYDRSLEYFNRASGKGDNKIIAP